MTNPIELPVQRSEPTTPLISITILFLGILATSFAAIFVRISEEELGPYATIFNRFWIAAIALGLWQCVRLPRHPSQNNPSQEAPVSSPSTRVWSLLPLAGIVAAVDLCLWAWSLSQTTVANATILGNFAPLFTALSSWLIWRTTFDTKFLVGLFLSLVGAIAIGITDLHIDPHHLKGDAIALLSALFFSIYLLLVEQLRPYLSTGIILFSNSALGALISGGLAVSEGQLFPHSQEGWLSVVGLALISQGLGQGLVAYSLNKISSGVVAVSFLLEPIIPALSAWILFSENLSPLNGLSFCLVLTGIYLAVTSYTATKEKNL